VRSPTRPTVYIVYWPTHRIIKAGYSERSRWRSFIGCQIVDLVEFDSHADAFDMETIVDEMLARHFGKAFSSASEAVPFLAGDGGGYRECYLMDEGIDPIEFLSTADWEGL